MWSILWQDVNVYEWVFIVIPYVNIHPFTIQTDSYSRFIDCPARGFQGHSPSKHCFSNCSDTPPAGKPTLRVLIFHYTATWPWKLIAGNNRNVKNAQVDEGNWWWWWQGICCERQKVPSEEADLAQTFPKSSTGCLKSNQSLWHNM